MPWKLSGLQIRVVPPPPRERVNQDGPASCLQTLTALSKGRRETSDRKLALASLQGLSTSRGALAFLLCPGQRSGDSRKPRRVALSPAGALISAREEGVT